MLESRPWVRACAWASIPIRPTCRRVSRRTLPAWRRSPTCWSKRPPLHAAAIKINVAFFEAFGSAGITALERVRAAVPADVLVIADAKRGDIANTVARQAAALFDTLGADAVTANPYLGRDALAPFLERDDRFVYVLCRTSNPGAAEFQNLPLAGGTPLFVHVARRAVEWAGDTANVGLVVGATAPREMAQIRAAAPGLPFLVPGLGAQAGDLDAVLKSGAATRPPGARVRGGALLVNVSRGISRAAAGRRRCRRGDGQRRP